MSSAEEVLNSIRLQRKKDRLAHSRGETAVEQGKGQHSIASSQNWTAYDNIKWKRSRVVS